jgi:CSLREA domain-containing protein
MMRCRLLLVSLVLAISIVPWGSTARPVYAAGFTVNSTADEPDAAPGDGACASTPSGACTLRAAVTEANALAGPDTITLPSGAYDLSFPPDPNQRITLNITSEITLFGASARTTTIRLTAAIAAGRLLSITSGGKADISGVTLRGIPNAASIRGGITNAGQLTLRQAVLQNNSTDLTGGGLENRGTATLDQVLVVGNSAVFRTGARPTNGSGGGIYNTGTLSLTNVTFTGNISVQRGGAIHTEGNATLTNVTFGENSVEPFGQGKSISAVTATVRNTIFGHPLGGNCAGPIQSVGNNIETGDSCSLNGSNDQKNADPRLGPLQNNGGPTDTYALQPDSPAIDRGTNAGCPATDQRGVPRPIDGNGDGVATCDIGSFEAPATGELPPVVCNPRPPVAVQTARTGDGRLRAAISANGTNNTLVSLRVARLDNAQVEVAGQAVPSGGVTVSLPPGTPATDLFLRPATAGQPSVVQFVVVDRCGEWSTFVGGGPSAF